MQGYDFEFTSIEGDKLPLSQYRGRPVLVVNTASFCGFTPQYQDLEALWRKYRDRGLVVIGVPSNDFGAQEPGTATEIKQFCEGNYAVDFPLTDKQAVIGRHSPSLLPLDRRRARRSRSAAVEFPQISHRAGRQPGRCLALARASDGQGDHGGGRAAAGGVRACERIGQELRSEPYPSTLLRMRGAFQW